MALDSKTKSLATRLLVLLSLCYTDLQQARCGPLEQRTNTLSCVHLSENADQTGVTLRWTDFRPRLLETLNLKERKTKRGSLRNVLLPLIVASVMNSSGGMLRLLPSLVFSSCADHDRQHIANHAPFGVGGLAWVRQYSTLKESLRRRPKSAMS